MKLTKTDAQKKGKKAKYTVKVERNGKERKVRISTDNNKELLASIETLVSQNKKMMAALNTSDNTEVMLKNIGELVIGLRDLSLKESQDTQMQVLQQAQRKKIIKMGYKTKTRDARGYLDTAEFIIEQEYEPLN